MRDIRAALAAPFRLLPFDLLPAVFIALVALSLIAAPALSQEAGSTPAPTAGPSPAPVTTAPATPFETLSQAEPTPAASPSTDPCAERPPWPTLKPEITAGPGVSPVPAQTPGPGATHAPFPNLCPAQPDGGDPLSFVAAIFTPIFNILFLGMVLLYDLTGDIGVAIILLTIIIRALMIPIFRRQIVSQRRMQMLQPELRVIQQKYKGDRAKISAEQMQLYKDRGVNPASGCLPAVLQLILLLPMYRMIDEGLKAPDITSMLKLPFFGTEVVDIQCQNPGDPYAPCINSDISWLAWLPKIELDPLAFLLPGYPGGMPANEPEIFLMVLPAFGLGLSLLAATSAVLQLIQTRMMMTRTDDPQQRTQQRIFLLLPAFSLIYGAILPAGLFIYWITTTVFSIVQQFLINGYGGLFPIRGWTPGFATDHTPRFPVAMPEPKPPPASDADGDEPTQSTKRSTKESAAGTIKPPRRRSRRRGRRR